MKSLIFLTKAFLFWMFFFFVQRLLFIGYNYNQLQTAPVTEILKTLLFALHLDFSTACYFVFFSSLILVISNFSSAKWILKVNKIIAFLLLLIALLICLSNTLLYKEWQSIISKRALSFLSYPKEIIASLSIGYLLLSILGIAVIQFLF